MSFDGAFGVVLARACFHIKRPAVHGAGDSSAFELSGTEGSTAMGAQVVQCKIIPLMKKQRELPALDMNRSALFGPQTRHISGRDVVT